MNSIIELLEIYGISPQHTGLVRHPASQAPVRHMYGEGLMDASMSLQNAGRFDRYDVLLSFMGFPDQTCLFLKAYKVAGLRGDIGAFMAAYPYPEHINAQSVLYNLLPEERLDPYANRLLIRWGEGQRAWLQKGTTHKPILRVFEEPTDPLALYDAIRKGKARVRDTR